MRSLKFSAFSIQCLILCLIASRCHSETVAQALKDGKYVSAATLPATAGHIPIGDGTSYPDCTVSGDITIASGGLVTIANGAVTAVKMVNAGVFTGDVTTTFPAITVTGINGVALGATTATDKNVLIANGTSWISRAISGDWTLTANTGTVTVAKINGATVPAAGALTTGNTLFVSGVSALSYGALNIAGGANYVSGTLPVANGGTNSNGALTGNRLIISNATPAIVEAGAMTDGQMVFGKTGSAPQIVTPGGDISGVTNAGAMTVSKINGNTLGATTATAGNVLQNDGSNWVSRQETFYDTHANRPAVAAANKNATYFETDTLTTFFSTGAAGAWNDIGFVDPGICEGRLTLLSGTAVTTADQTAKGTIYFTPYKGCRVAIYNGTLWKMYKLTEISLVWGALTAGDCYDIYVYDNAGTLTLEVEAWTNSSTRDASPPVLQDGVYCKTGALTRRYLGTVYMQASTTTDDSVNHRFVYNYYNRVKRVLRKTNANASWSYTTATWREAHGDSGVNQIETVVGFAEDMVNVEVNTMAGNTLGSCYADVGIGLDSATVNSAHSFVGFIGVANEYAQSRATYRDTPAIGYHKFVWIESSTATGTTTWYGTNGTQAPGSSLSGIFGETMQ